jgi:hypothetical protein
VTLRASLSSRKPTNFECRKWGFQPGNKFSKGGVKGNKGGGRDSAKRKEVKRMVADEVRAFIEREVRPVLGVYKKIAMGVKRPLRDRDGKLLRDKRGKVVYQTEYDPATVRDWVNKFVLSVLRQAKVGQDGRPLVPVTIIAPDFNGIFTPQPEAKPEPEQPKGAPPK